VSFINYANREINCKIVYCGPGLSGKTTNIVQIYRAANPSFRGKLVTLNTEMDRTLFFDFLSLGRFFMRPVGGLSSRVRTEWCSSQTLARIGWMPITRRCEI
jgi:hypothetical protein